MQPDYSVRPDYRVGGRGDLYDRNMCVKWTVNIFIAIFIIGYLMYGVLIINFHEEYNWFTQAGNPCGVLVSTRYNNITYWAITFSVFRLFFLLALLAIIGFKNVKGCTTAWVAVMFVCIAIDFFVWVILLANGLGHNTPGNPTIADDLLKCNAAPFYEYPEANRCLNGPLVARAFDLTQDELEWNEDFKWLFAANTVYLFLMDALLMGFTMVIWFGISNWEEMDMARKKTMQNVRETVKHVTHQVRAAKRVLSGKQRRETEASRNDPLSTSATLSLSSLSSSFGSARPTIGRATHRKHSNRPLQQQQQQQQQQHTHYRSMRTSFSTSTIPSPLESSKLK